MTKCNCGNVLIDKEFTYEIVRYCEYCFHFDIIVKECQHPNETKIPVKIKISNGSYQVRLYCKECKILDSKSQKQSNYNLNNIKESTIDSFNDYKQKVLSKEKEEYNKILNSLRGNKIQTLKDIYESYIKSDKWKEKRNLVLIRDNNKCQICGGKAMDIHHLTYMHLEREYLFELVALCRECHNKEYHKDNTNFDKDVF